MSDLADLARRGYPTTLSGFVELVTVMEANERELRRVLDAIPECPAHGACIPHALEWIEKAKAAMGESAAGEELSWPEYCAAAAAYAKLYQPFHSAATAAELRRLRAKLDKQPRFREHLLKHGPDGPPPA